ncbi:MAG TPA: OadG family protein [Clostridia bacterium]|nr:OadG family protein [Clostridia bacterium]
MANFGDTFIYSLIVTLFGLGIVFIVLVLLQYILKTMKFFNREKKESPKVTAATEGKAAAEPAAQSLNTAEVQEDEELVAAITAAVIACLGGNSSIVVRKIRRVEDMTPAWGKASRLDQMAGRF